MVFFSLISDQESVFLEVNQAFFEVDRAVWVELGPDPKRSILKPACSVGQGPQTDKNEPCLVAALRQELVFEEGWLN